MGFVADLTVTLSCGVRMCVPDSVDLMTTYVLLEQENWFEDETGFVRKVLRPGDRVLDVGANHGVYTLQAALRVGPTGRVWAFEPAPAPGACLEKSLALNGFENVTLVKAAVADTDGEASLRVEANSELSYLGEGGEPVRVRSLDGCAAELGLQDLALVKLDAEGAERRILDGGAAVFERQSPLVLFERVHGAVIDTELVDRFAALGYGIYRLAPGPGILVPFERDEPADSFQLNLFACKPDRAEALEARGLLAQRSEDLPLAATYAESADENSGSPAQLMSHARLARAWGKRQEAVAVLTRLEGLLSPESSDSRELLAAVLEQRELLGHYSSYFTGLSTLPSLDRHSGLGFPSIAIERRRYLIRLKHGQKPEPCELLTVAGPGHSNPEFFRR